MSARAQYTDSFLPNVPEMKGTVSEAAGYNWRQA